LVGNSANNVLNGGTGVDTMVGGAGDDTYVVDNTGDVITENANEGVDLVQSSVTYTLGANVENLTLTGTVAINGTGNTLDNVLTGNSGVNVLTGGAGNDTLDGGAGADRMLGGIGNDTYVVDNTGDVVTENANEGVDLVRSSVTYTLAANVENLTLTGATAINGTGNTLNNALVGNSANNILTGGAGNDTLNGGAGSDTLTGGIGADLFVFSHALGSTNRDTLTDFNAAEGDRVQLDRTAFGQIGGKTSLDGMFRHLTQAADGNHFIVYDRATGKLFYDQSGQGSAMVEFATLSNRPQDLVPGAFVIV
jgi:Ca2+-binding RTX toxin-like protein